MTTILFIVLGVTSAFSQSLSIHKYTSKDGLPSNTITTITQDSKGFIWIGTYDGISMYDGESFRNYRNQDSPGGVVVTCAIESRKTQGSMIVGMIDGGISMVSNERSHHVVSLSPAVNSSPTCIIEDAEGTLWCTMYKAVKRIKDGSVLDTVLVFPDSIDAQLAYIDNQIAVGAGNRIHFYSTGGKELRTISLDRKTVILKLYVDKNKSLWVTTSDCYLMEYSGNTLLGKCKLPAAAKDLVLDAEGFLWLATKTSGLIKLPLDSWTKSKAIIYGTKNGLPDNNISCVFVDAEKNLWIGTWNKGLVKLTDKTSLKFDFTGSQQIQSLVVDNYGNAWNANPPNGIMEFYKGSNEVWQCKLHKLDLSAETLNGQIVNRPGNKLWAFLSDGTIIELVIHHIDGEPSELVQNKRIKILPPGQVPYRIYIDPKQRLWCSVLHSDTVLVYDVSGTARLLKTYEFPKDIPIRAVRAIGSDNLGNVWLGGFFDGLVRISPGWKMKQFTTEDGLPDNGIRSIEKDELGRLWIGTRYGGVSVYDGTNFTNISTEQGLLSNTVWCLSYDGHHRMWLATPLGSMWVSTTNLEEMGWYSSTTGYETFSCVTNNEQNLWAKTADEIIFCDYGKIKPNTVPPPVYISSIKLDDRPITSLSAIEAPYEKNTWTFHYAGLSFQNESSVRFRYRLLGSTNEWSEPTPEHTVIFAELKPGSYQFEVEAINNDGVSSLKPAAYRFTILPPFWQRLWFILLTITFLGGAVVLILQSRFKRLKEEEHRQAEFSRLLIDLQEKERKRIASELHDGLGQNLLIIKNLADMGNSGQDQKKYLDDISSIAGRSVAEVREIAQDLRPHLLDKLGLTKCLRSMVRKTAESSGISITEKICELENLFSPEKEINIYRFIQESINNIIKHSEATEALVSIIIKDNKLSILVSDNGKGFSVDRSLKLPSSRSGEFGLITMAERVHLLKGRVGIVSKPGKGTWVKAKIPITREI